MVALPLGSAVPLSVAVVAVIGVAASVASSALDSVADTDQRHPLNLADRFEMDAVELLVNIPSVGEEYHASWRSTSKVEQHDAWRSEIPLIIDGQRVGHIKVLGVCGNGSICEWMSDLIGGLRPFETQLIELIGEVHEKYAPQKSPSLTASDSLQLPQQATA